MCRNRLTRATKEAGDATSKTSHMLYVRSHTWHTLAERAACVYRSPYPQEYCYNTVCVGIYGGTTLLTQW